MTRRCDILKGELEEVSLVDLIRVTCNGRRPSHLTVRIGDREASLFFDSGGLVHAELGDLRGEAALHEVLKWSQGSFELERNAPAPEQTLSDSSSEILLAAMEQIDTKTAGSGWLDEEVRYLETVEIETSILRELKTSEVDVNEDRSQQNVVRQLRRIPGVEGAVLVARDGTVLAYDLDGNAEKEGAVTVFVGNAAHEIGETLALGSFDRGVVEVGKSRTLVIEQPSHFVGLLLAERTSPELMLAEARKVLE